MQCLLHLSVQGSHYATLQLKNQSSPVRATRQLTAQCRVLLADLEASREEAEVHVPRGRRGPTRTHTPSASWQRGVWGFLGGDRMISPLLRVSQNPARWGSEANDLTLVAGSAKPCPLPSP